MNNVAHHARDMCGVGVGWDNYKHCSCIEECETLWLLQEQCSTPHARLVLG